MALVVLLRQSDCRKSPNGLQAILYIELTPLIFVIRRPQLRPLSSVKFLKPEELTTLWLPINPHPLPYSD